MDIANEAYPTEPDGALRPSYHPTPDNPPWNGWVAFAVWLLSVLFVTFVPAFFLVPYVMSQGMGFDQSDLVKNFLQTDPTAVILQLAPVILAHAFTLAAAWFVVTKFNTYSFRETLGWKMNGFKAWHGILVTVGFWVILLVLFSIFGEVENDFDKMIKSSRYAVYLVAFLATFTAPLVEEVIYRGLLFSAFQRRFGLVIAVVLVTLLFTAVHVPQYSVGAVPDFATIIALLLLSLTLTMLRARTGNLLPCIVLHTIFNGIQSCIMIAEPYIRSTQPVVDPATLFLK